jgi:hypothetical protein
LRSSKIPNGSRRSALPEISSGIAAVRLGDNALAIGDVFGGNAFQVCLFLLADLVAGAPVLPTAGTLNGWLAALGIALTAVYAIGVVARPQRCLVRLGPDSILALVLFRLIAIVSYLWNNGGHMVEGLSPALVLRLVGDAAARREDAERHFREMVVTARAAGIPLKRIADAAGLSTSRIHAIVEEEQEFMSNLTATHERPRPSTPDDDVLVVAGGKIAVADYLRHDAYICQPTRSFRDVERIGFYRRGKIEPFFPRIRYRKMNLEWTRATARALRETGAALDAEVADVIDRTLDDPADPRREGRPYQVFLLTPQGDPQTLRLAQPIQHRTLGRGTAWTQGTRYASEEALRRNPRTTDELR